MIDEIWKDIPGYEGFYQISNKGRVKSLVFKDYKREKILKYCKNINRYSTRFFIDLKRNCIKERFYIHQLVALAFIGPCPEGMEVCHNDGNAENNCAENLRYGTHQENMRDMIRHGTNNGKGPAGEKNGNSILTDNQVKEIIQQINDGINFEQIANNFNVSIPVISNIKCKRLWKHLSKDVEFKERVNKGSTKFNDDQIKYIKQLIKDNIPSKEIAKQFNVSYETINRIKKNQTFKDVNNV